MSNLSASQILSLIDRVFRPRPEDHALTFLVDLPTPEHEDSPSWKDRRRIVAEWYTALLSISSSLPFSRISFCTYPNVGANNGDLPLRVTLVDTMHDLQPERGEQVGLESILSVPGIVIAATEFSATAPLKNLAKKLGFRGATMPGFTRSMIPALLLDYEAIHGRVLDLKLRMDRADGATVLLAARSRKFKTFFDLRFREGHASGGIIREPGAVANLPSGEAYIVPYEGERSGDSSRTRGTLPLQIEDEIVEVELLNNKAQTVTSSGKNSAIYLQRFKDEPAFGNISELGIGVLGEWGVKASGSTLLDEKLGLHVAFGRSDHFGGVVGPAQFRNPGNVCHIDWVYVPSVQPDISVESVVFHYGEESETIIERGKLRGLHERGNGVNT